MDGPWQVSLSEFRSQIRAASSHSGVRHSYGRSLCTLQFCMANVIRPSDFLYLMERSLILFGSSKGYIFVTKSYFVEWVIFQDGSTIFQYSKILIQVLVKILLTLHCSSGEENKMKWWIGLFHKNIEIYHLLMILRVAILPCLFALNCNITTMRRALQSLVYVCTKSPREFYDALFHEGQILTVRMQLERLKRLSILW